MGFLFLSLKSNTVVMDIHSRSMLVISSLYTLALRRGRAYIVALDLLKP
jgi:hypothetical protein